VAPWVILFGLAGAASAATAASPPVSVTLDAGQLSVTAEAAPAGAVLSAIAEASGVAVHVDPGVRPEALAHPVSVRLVRQDVERALAQVLDPAHYVFLYSPAGLAEVRVYSWTPGGPRPTSSVRPAPATADADGAEADDKEKEAERAEAVRWSRESLAAADPEARVDALERLSDVGDPALITRTAIDVLGQEQHAEVLDAALDLLADQESPVVEPLLQFAGTTPNRELRVRALEILAEQSPGDPRVAGLVRTLASQDQDPDFRETAADLLKSLGAP
jgi:hypothetical protein